MARIDKGQRHMQPLDMSATKLDTPRLNQQDDLSAWQACSSNAAAQLEHQHNRCASATLTSSLLVPAQSSAHDSGGAFEPLLGSTLQR